MFQVDALKKLLFLALAIFVVVQIYGIFHKDREWILIFAIPILIMMAFKDLNKMHPFMNTQ